MKNYQTPSTEAQKGRLEQLTQLLEITSDGDLINKTEQDAKEWAESRMNEFKKEFILSLITKFGDDLYIFGIGVMQIVGGYDGIDRWRVYQNSEHELFEGTLEECKNYIASCF